MGAGPNNPYVQVRGGVGGFYPTPSSDSSPTKNEHQTESLCMVLKIRIVEKSPAVFYENPRFYLDFCAWGWCFPKGKSNF